MRNPPPEAKWNQISKITISWHARYVKKALPGSFHFAVTALIYTLFSHHRTSWAL